MANGYDQDSQLVLVVEPVRWWLYNLFSGNRVKITLFKNQLNSYFSTNLLHFSSYY